MGTNYTKTANGINIVPSTPANSATGDMAVSSTTGKLEYHNGTSSAIIPTVSSTDTLTNKSIDADTNTITNIENADIKVGANIDAEKIGTGAVTTTEFNYLDGVTSSIQTQLDSKISDPGTVTDDAVVRWNGTSGAAVNDSGVILNDSNEVSGVAKLNVDNIQIDGNTINATNSNGNVNLSVTGTGVVQVGSSNVTATTGGVVSITGQLNIDSLRLDGTTFLNTAAGSSDITIQPAGASGQLAITTPLRMSTVSTPGTPAGGTVNLYFKSDDLLYQKDSNGVESLVSQAALTAPTQQRFTTGTAATYTTPANVLYLRVRLIGGGGGGSGGGSAAGTAATDGTASSFTDGTVTLTGNGGAHGVWAAAGPAGGTASISGGTAFGSAFTGGKGTPGGGGQGGGTPDSEAGPRGAGTPFSDGGAGGLGSGGAGQAPTANSGAGGGAGGSSNTGSGFAGTSGAAGGYLEAFLPSPSASYTYTVGTKGNAGGAGTGGDAGGDGADGYIEVTEYYQ